MLAPEQTIISQFANSPTIGQLVTSMNGYLDPGANFDAFYNLVWNVETAIGFGLDIWGKIVQVPRVLNAPGTVPIFGFYNSGSPTDFSPFNVAPFSSGGNATSAYSLPDDVYRRLILTKGLANICFASTPAINAVLSFLMAGKGKAYVVEHANMAVDYKFEFVLSPLDYAILTQSNVVPHPTGVAVTIVSL